MFSKLKKTLICWIVCRQLGVIIGSIHTLFCESRRAAFTTCYLGSLPSWSKDQPLLMKSHCARFRRLKRKIGLCSLSAVVPRWMGREGIYSKLPVSYWEHPDLLMFFAYLVNSTDSLELWQLPYECRELHISAFQVEILIDSSFDFHYPAY